MDATIKMQLSPRNAVPEKGRVEWLERFGVLPQQAEVAITAPLRAWRNAGAEVKTNGTLYTDHILDGALTKAVYQLIVESGQVPAELPAPIVTATLQACAQEIASKRAESEADSVKRAAEDAARDAERARVKALPAEALISQAGGQWKQITATKSYTTSDQDEAAAALCAERNAAPMRAWIAEHGSERLKLAIKLGLSVAVEKSYWSERLTAERPGWRFESDDRGYDKHEEIIEPSLEVLQALEEAVKTDPAVELVYLVTSHDSDCPRGDDCTCDARKGPALATTWLGRKIVRDL